MVVEVKDKIHVRPELRKTTKVGIVTRIGEPDSLGNYDIEFRTSNGEEWVTNQHQVRKIIKNNLKNSCLNEK